MSDGYSRNFLQGVDEIQLSRDKLGEQKFLESVFFRILQSLKSKTLATMVPPRRYTEFITNLSFRATRRLERMA